MLKNYLAKKSAKKSATKGATWMAKREAQVIFTALATIATQKLIQKAAKKYPMMKPLKVKS